jgi:hypothetical protein
VYNLYIAAELKTYLPLDFIARKEYTGCMECNCCTDPDCCTCYCDDLEMGIDDLLTLIIKDKSDRDIWMNDMNLEFGMSPLEMIKLGREEEVIKYLMYQIEGPY